jgi:hypothetical protein
MLRKLSFVMYLTDYFCLCLIIAISSCFKMSLIYYFLFDIFEYCFFFNNQLYIEIYDIMISKVLIAASYLVYVILKELLIFSVIVNCNTYLICKISLSAGPPSCIYWYLTLMANTTYLIQKAIVCDTEQTEKSFGNTIFFLKFPVSALVFRKE